MDSVTNITYSVTGPNAVLVTWAPVTGATSYLVEIRSSNVTLQSLSVTVPEVPFTALVIGQLYEVLVTPTDGIVEGPRNRHVVYLSVQDWLGRVGNLAYTELPTRDGFTVTWDPSPSATSYRLLAEAYNDNTVIYDGPASSPYTLTGLEPEKLYRVSVTPFNGEQEGITAVIVGWVQPAIEDGRSTKTSHLLFPATTQGSYHLIYRPYIENMRPLYEDERYWRFVDHFDFIDGPTAIGQSYPTENITWKVELVHLETNETEIWVRQVNLDNSNHQLLYTHTEMIKSVAIEFDQSGRQIIVFESNNVIYVYFYDTTQSKDVLLPLGNGVTPIVTTDTYYRRGGSSASERFIFFVEKPTNKIVGFRQLDRYGIKYVINNDDTREALELLQVSKTLTGALSIIAAVREADGSVVQAVWSYRKFGEKGVNIGSDGDYVDPIFFTPFSGLIDTFTLKPGAISLAVNNTNETSNTDNSSVFTPTTGTITNFDIRSAQYYLLGHSDPVVSLSPLTGTVTGFKLKNSKIHVEEQNDSGLLTFQTGTVNYFSVKETVIYHTAEMDSGALSLTTATITTFTLG